MKKQTNAQFILKAREKHGNKYIYSKSIYIHSHDRLIITCPKHGDFEQTPHSHLAGRGCPVCRYISSGSKRKLSDQQFIDKSNQIHNNFYNYSKVNYIKTNMKVTITCPVHGDFEQTPNSHLNGTKCPKCSISMKTSTLDQFILKACQIHGNKYNYSKVKYVDTNTNVLIICPVHGNFTQLPYVHTQGFGCKFCGYDNKKLTIEEFIEKARAIHGDKYDYSQVIYINSDIKVKIICPIHGEFWQKPSAHLNCSGCKKCFIQNKKLTIEEFIKKAHQKHEHKYDYSKVNYINSQTKVSIMCPIHGEFEQKPNNHLNGHGCPTCRSSKGELQIKNILEQNHIKFLQEYKLPNQTYQFEYDFYLPDYNLLIEFHGIQHFKYIPFFHRNGEEDLLQQQERDIFKKALAKELKYRFLEVNYKQFKYLGKTEFEKFIMKNIN